MYRKIFAMVFVILALTLPAHAQALSEGYDVVIAGGGTGGTAAAIQAAKMGMNVLIVEPTNMLGGQATASGVSTMDDLSGQTSGLYREFMERVEEYYSARGKAITTCYWDAQNKAFEPKTGSKILADMARGEDAPDILFKSKVIGVGTEEVISVSSENMTSGKKVNSVIIQTPNGKINRKVLPVPELKRSIDYVAPEGKLETLFASIFADVLKIEQVGALDNFFEIGGTSINAIKVIVEASKHDVMIVFNDLFKVYVICANNPAVTFRIGHYGS